MAVRIWGISALIIAGFLQSTSAQLISFSSPIPWVTLRSDTITVRAQVDTAQLKNKNLTLSLVAVKAGKTTSIATKKFKLTSTSDEFSMGTINRSLLGGEEYLRLNWSISGIDEKGTLEPIGIVDLNKMPKTAVVATQHVADGSDKKAVAGLVVDAQFKMVGGIACAPAWNKEAFFLVVKKSDVTDTVKVLFDGKSGKNAFLSYPDRVVACAVATDSVWGMHYNRAVQKNELSYIPEMWNNSITSEVVGDKIVIAVPWYDIGIIPFEERTISAGLFAIGGDGKNCTALPESAKYAVPGTWGELLLQK